MKYSSIITAGALVGGILIWAGCSNNPASSDTPVAINASSVGQLAFTSISEGNGSSSGISTMGSAPDLLVLPSKNVVMPKTTALGKSQSGGVSWTIDSLGNTISYVGVDSSLLKIENVTIVVQLIAPQNIVSLSSKTTYIDGKIESFQITDGDNDGVVNGEIQYRGKAIWNSQTQYTKTIIGHRAGEVEKAVWIVDAGEDKSYDTSSADNNIYKAEWVKLSNTDTIAYARYNDVDGDGTIVKPGYASKVSLDLFDSNNPSKPLLKSGWLHTQIDIAADGSKKKVRFAASETLITGRINRVYVTDTTGDSTVTTGELAKLYLNTTSPFVSDSEVSAQVMFVIDPGMDLESEADNILHEVKFDRKYRNRAIDELHFDFKANPPVPNGQQPTGGDFSITVLYVNGKTASMIGTCNQGVLDATYTDPDGVITHVIVDRSGKVINK